MTDALQLRQLGMQDYATVYQRMQVYTAQRNEASDDEIWFVEHPPVFTQGQAGKPEHLLAPGDIPVVQSDRGGQVTFHGPGQQVVYFLIDLNRRGYGIRSLVTRLENAIIQVLSGYGIDSAAQADAPGVYVDGAKIASIGLRVRKACTYHGISLNVNMDLSSFARINPCGYAGLRMTQLADFVPGIQCAEVFEPLQAALLEQLGYRQTAGAAARGVDIQSAFTQR